MIGREVVAAGVLAIGSMWYTAVGAQSVNVIAIGDSNGAAREGWPRQLDDILDSAVIANYSIAGNTIGFDNLGRRELNTVENLPRYISEGFDRLARVDYVILMLGTNDCKAQFSGLGKERIDNFRRLLAVLDSIVVVSSQHQSPPRIFVLTPPPVEEELSEAKYAGACKCVAGLRRTMIKATARRKGVTLIDIHARLSSEKQRLTTDGIHLTKASQIVIANEIKKHLSD